MKPPERLASDLMTPTTNPDGDFSPAPVSFTMGDVPFTVISDGPLAIGPPSVCFPELPADAALAAFGTEVKLPQNLLVADLAGARILFETGLGSTFAGSAGRDAGHALDGLRAVGIDPDSIDIIALTHAHPDHVGGLTAQDGTAVFGRAEIAIARPEYESVVGEGEETDPESFAARQRAFARKSLAPHSDRVRCLDDGDELVPGVTLLASPGHSPGHAVYLIETTAGPIVSWGDTCHHDVLLRWPDFGFSADADSLEAARARRRLLARIASEGWRVHAYHFPSPGIGEVRAQGDSGYEWQSVDLGGGDAAW